VNIFPADLFELRSEEMRSKQKELHMTKHESTIFFLNAEQNTTEWKVSLVAMQQLMSPFYGMQSHAAVRLSNATAGGVWLPCSDTAIRGFSFELYVPYLTKCNYSMA
jgi:hypothetical protein